MKLNIVETDLRGVKIITPPTVFEDFRGHYVETYNEEIYKAAGIDVNFKQDDVSVSRKHVLRGIHGNRDTWKLVGCLYGAFYLVVVNNDPESPQYLRWQGFTLSDVNRHQVLIPPKFGNGHVVMTDIAIFHYKQNTNYDRNSQFTLKWNDPNLKIFWPIRENLILSERDA